MELTDAAGLEVADPDGEFVVERKVFKLIWAEGDEFAGLVVRVQSLPLGMLLDLAPKVDALQNLSPTDLGPEAMNTVLEPFRALGALLVSWNLKERVGTAVKPVPATFEGLISQSPDLIRAVLRAWMQAAGSVAAPLGRPSPNGLEELSTEDLAALEASLGMTALPRSSGEPG